MSLTITRALEWDAGQVRLASKTLGGWAEDVDGLCAQFATATDLSAVWHGEAGAAAAVDARGVADNIARLSSMLSWAAQNLRWAADSLEGAQGRLMSGKAALHNLGFDLFEIDEDGVLRPRPFTGWILAPGYDSARAEYEQKIELGEIYASRVRQALSDIDVAEGQVRAALEDALNVPTPVRAPGWVLVEAAHLENHGHDDPAVAKVLDELASPSLYGFNDTDQLADFANSLDALSADQVDEVINEANLYDLGMLAVVGHYQEIVTGTGPVFFTGMDDKTRLKIINKILKSVDPDTLRDLQFVMASLLEPEPHVEGIGGSDGFKYKSIDAPLFHAGGAPVRADDIYQGADGDCWFLASLGTVALQHPKLITDNIHQNSNGTYTVTFFPKGKRTEVTVTGDVPYADVTDPQSDWGSGIYMAGPDDRVLGPLFEGQGADASSVSWPVIYEKAYAQLRGGYEAIDGGLPPTALKDIVGPALHVESPGTGHIDVADINRRLAAGATIVLGSKDSGDRAWRDKTLGVLKNHDYMVVAADPSSGKLTLRNPWGGDPTSAGAPPVIALTPAEIAKDFDGPYIGNVRS